MIRKQRLCHDSLFKSMETKNVIELSAFSKSLSKKITYLNHEERILIDKVTTIGPDYILVLKVNNNNFNLKINFINLSKI